ncbi:transcriptional regulator [Benzoatithermus flavus]|uniref:HTH cro/C1-type domain-containing protein n=1 Tax=Benzoatithermus flavus TaxID=3108223 RepID=A0ABU8XX94_9PROT
MNRRDTARIFRERLTRIVQRTGGSLSAFARSIGLDRSALSQLLDPEETRLPRAETLAAIAAAHRVSVDWLLGLSQREQVGADIIEEVFRVEPAASSPVDQRFLDWYREAAGYKIRTVPRSFPDMLKQEAVIRFEYASALAIDPDSNVESAQARLAYLRRPDTDVEACASVQAFTGFARAEGAWEGLDAGTRRAQLAYMASLCDELYPGFRLFLYDLRRTYSAPFTVFGPLRATLYLGQMYLVFNSRQHIQLLTRRFDDLVRAATLQPPDVPTFLRRLADAL